MNLKIAALGLALAAAASGTASAAVTFTVGQQAAANPTAGNFLNVWPSSGGESPGNAIDDNLTNKYLNFAKNNTGYIFSPGAAAPVSASIIGINFVSGNDAPLRDPTSFQLYGSNTASANTTAGTIYNVSSDFTLIASGAISLPDQPDGNTRNNVRTTFNTSFAATGSYTTFLLVFPTVKGSTDPAVNSMQIGEARLQTASGPLTNLGVIAGGQLTIPEPAATALLFLAGAIGLRRRR